MCSSDLNCTVEEIDACPVQIQGPKSKALMKDLCGDQVDFDNMPFYGLAEVKVGGRSCVISQSGFSGDLEFGKKGNIDYGKIGTGKSGLGTINSEVDSPFNFEKGSVALARTQKYNTEDSQFFIVLRDEPLYETEYTPIGKVIYGLKALEKIKYLDKSQYVLRPDFINSIRMLIN